MNKNQSQKVRAIGAQPTKEELEQQAKRAFLQKRNSLAEIFLSNALHNVGPETSSAIMKALVDLSIEAADYFMEKAYSVAIKEAE